MGGAGRILAVVVAVLAFSAGWFAGARLERSRGDAEVASLRSAVSEAEDGARKTAERAASSDTALRAEIDAMRRRIAALESRPAAPPAAGVPDEESAEKRRARSLLLRVQLEDHAAKGEGGAVLAGLRELASILPDGREPATALVAAVRDDRERLGIDEKAWEAFLSHPSVVALQEWALEHGAPDAFRELAAWSLPGRTPPDRLVPLFATALAAEKETDVMRGLAEGLGGAGTPAALGALREILGDATRDRRARVFAATELAVADDAATRAARQALADADADEVVLAAVRATAAARNPPAGGYLVTGFVSGSTTHPSGLAVGDVILTYDGRNAAQELGPAIAGALGREGKIPIDVQRAGTRVSISADPGWLGLIGKPIGK